MAFNAGDIESTLQLDRTPFNRGLALARREAVEFERRGINVKLDVDDARAQATIKRLEREKITIDLDIDSSKLRGVKGLTNQARSAAAGINIPLSVDPQSVKKIQGDVEDIARNTELTARRSGNRIARGLLNPLVIQLGLLPAVALASTAAAGLAIGGLTAVFGAVGAVALKNNESLKSTWADMWQNLKTEAAASAAPLLDTFDNLAGDITRTWTELRPTITQLFADVSPLIENVTDGLLGMASEAVPRFQRALAVSGPLMRGFESMLRQIGTGLGEMTVNIAGASIATGQSLGLLGGFLRNLLGDLGSLIAIFSRFYAQVGPEFNATFDRIIDTLLQFTEGGLSGTADGLQVLFSVINTGLGILGPFASIFGQVTGYALAAVGTWKLLAGTIGLVGKAWGLIAPGAVAGRLVETTGRIQGLARSAGEYTAVMFNSAIAGERMEKGVTRIGNAVVRAAAVTPLFGIAIAGIASAIDHFYPSADKLASAILQGGAAAVEASQRARAGAESGISFANAFAESSADVAKAIDKQRDSMTTLEVAQMDAAAAQQTLDYFTQQYGQNSPEAAEAATQLAIMTNRVEAAQAAAADATKDHTDRMIEQTNLMLGAVGAALNYQSSLLSLEQAEISLNTAIKDHGAGSLEARQADISYQQTLLSTIEAIGARVKAENMSQGETKATELATAATRVEIARLAVAAGENLPPALATMAAKLTDAELKAIGVTRSVDGTGRSIYRLPPGKSLKFPTNAPAATDAVNTLAGAVNRLPTQKYFTYFVKTVQSGLDLSTGGGLSVPGQIPPRAKGGPVKAKSPYWVGEEGIPELFFPDMDGFVMSGRDSADLLRKLNASDSIAQPSPATSAGALAQPLGGDQGDIVGALRDAISAALAEVRLRFDRSELAEIVSEADYRNARR